MEDFILIAKRAKARNIGFTDTKSNHNTSEKRNISMYIEEKKS